MFNPTREQVRTFFCEAWRKHRERLILEGAEAVAADLITHHPEYHALLEDPRVSAAQLDEIVSLMTETLCSGKETISVGGEEHPAETVKEQLKRLTSEHIEYVLLCMRRTTGPIRNIRRYLLTALYNAPMTLESFNQAEVNRQLRRQVVSCVR